MCGSQEKFKEAYEHDDRSIYIDEVLVANRMEAEYKELMKQKGLR